MAKPLIVVLVTFGNDDTKSRNYRPLAKYQ